MIFRDIQLVNAGPHGEERLSQNRYLMAYWENLRDIFCTFLPSKFNFNGIAKLNIYLGSFEGEDFTEAGSDGIASFRRSDFDFSSFSELSEHEKSKLSLFYITDTLLYLCQRLGLSGEAALATVVRSANLMASALSSGLCFRFGVVIFHLIVNFNA